MQQITAVGDAYTAVNKTQHLTSTETSSYYRVVRAMDGISYSSGNTVGDVVFNLYLDTDMDDDLEELSSRFEYKTFSNVKLDMVCTAPLGTTSGSLQIGHTTDPENATFTSTGSGGNRSKLVRQQGSVVLRPRDTVTLDIDTPGVMYCKRAGSRRFSSWGAVTAVVRTLPAMGDTVYFAATLTADVHFHRLSVINNEVSAYFDASLDFDVHHIPETDTTRITFLRPGALPSARATLSFDPLELTRLKEDEKGLVKRERIKVQGLRDFKCLVPDFYTKEMKGKVELARTNGIKCRVITSGPVSDVNTARHIMV